MEVRPVLYIPLAQEQWESRFLPGLLLLICYEAFCSQEGSVTSTEAFQGMQDSVVGRGSWRKFASASSCMVESPPLEEGLIVDVFRLLYCWCLCFFCFFIKFVNVNFFILIKSVAYIFNKDTPNINTIYCLINIYPWKSGIRVVITYSILTFLVSESISTLSINDTSVLDGEGWDADSSSAGLICQKLHKEFARKIEASLLFIRKTRNLHC